MKKLVLLAMGIFLLFSLSLAQNHPLRINLDQSVQVSIQSDQDVLLSSNPAALWTVYTDWTDHWPADAHTIRADSAEEINGYVLLHGSLPLPAGKMVLRDAYKPEGDLIRCTRRWEWHGSDTLKKVTLTIAYRIPDAGKRILMPGIMYYGNPAGERSRNTPVIRGRSGEISLFEEHRFPMPFVSGEWGSLTDSKAAALHSLPSPVPFGNRPDQWWSLGTIQSAGFTELCLYSGSCAFNEETSVIKAFQGGDMMESYDEAWINMPPGCIIEKTFYLQTQTNLAQGSGFQAAVEASLNLFQPWELTTLPDYDEILESKLKFAQSRYEEGPDYAGFRKYPDRRYFVLGWCGQAMAPGYAMQVLSKKFTQADHPDQVQHSLDFLSQSGFYESGFYTWYNLDKKEWFMNHTPEWLSQGQAMLNIANAIRVADASYDTKKWVEFLKKAADFHSARILSDEWNPESTNEGFFIAPLVLSAGLLNNPVYLRAAEKAARYYADLYLTMDQVYWGGTLDASCEDKEGAFAALQGFIELYDYTKKTEYLQWAKHAGDVCLTYLVDWDIPLPAGRLTDHQFKTRGWTAVSVQNMHIDVYGVLIAPYIYRLGLALNNEVYQKSAELMFRSCGQLIDPYGSQGEQPYQTNYIQTGWKDKPVHERRGNYLETWTVFWITAHFLNAGAMLMELGVF